jgi:hypothetical protein
MRRRPGYPKDPPMPLLPNADRAFVAPRKITHYLLAHDHPKGGAKAAFFESFGFAMDRWQELSEALLAHAAANPVVAVHSTSSGTKYEISGPLPAPDGRTPIVKSVWIIDTGSTAPRFITAVPD